MITNMRPTVTPTNTATPTYSADRARLALSHPNSTTVYRYEDARGEFETSFASTSAGRTMHHREQTAQPFCPSDAPSFQRHHFSIQYRFCPALPLNTIDAVLTWAVAQPHSPFRRRVSLDTDGQWKAFLDSCCHGRDAREEGGDITINLERVLKACYERAFSMPPSPLAGERSSPEFAVRAAGRGSPTPLSI